MYSIVEGRFFIHLQHIASWQSGVRAEGWQSCTIGGVGKRGWGSQELGSWGSNIGGGSGDIRSSNGMVDGVCVVRGRIRGYDSSCRKWGRSQGQNSSRNGAQGAKGQADLCGRKIIWLINWCPEYNIKNMIQNKNLPQIWQTWCLWGDWCWMEFKWI